MDAVADRGWSVAESSGSDAAPDAALMGRIAAGDQGAFRLAIDRHLGAVHALGWRLLRNRADAEDVAQEAFLRLWRRAPAWQEGGTIAAFLLRVAYNLSIDRLRRQAAVALDDAPEPLDPAPTPPKGWPRRNATAPSPRRSSPCRIVSATPSCWCISRGWATRRLRRSWVSACMRWNPCLGARSGP